MFCEPGVWVHLNCAYWSSETHENAADGTIVAVRRCQARKAPRLLALRQAGRVDRLLHPPLQAYVSLRMRDRRKLPDDGR